MRGGTFFRFADTVPDEGVSPDLAAASVIAKRIGSLDHIGDSCSIGCFGEYGLNNKIGEMIYCRYFSHNGFHDNF